MTGEDGSPANLGAALEAQFRAIAEAMPQMVWTALPGGAVDYVNAQIYEYTGVPREPNLWTWERVVHPDDMPALREAWQRSVEAVTVQTMSASATWRARPSCRR